MNGKKREKIESKRDKEQKKEFFLINKVERKVNSSTQIFFS